MLSRLSIRWRLILSFAVVIAIVIGAKVVESYYDNQLEIEYRLVRASNRAAINSEQLDTQLLTVVSELRRYELVGSADALNSIEAAKKRFDEIDAMMIETYTAAGESRARQLAWVQEIGNLFNNFIKQVVDPAIEIRRQVDGGQISLDQMSYRINNLNAGKHITAMNAVVEDLVNTALENVRIEAEAYDEVRRAANLVSLVSIVLAVVVSLLIAFFTARYIASRLQMAVGVADATAGGDLTARIDTSGSDEISHLLQSIAKMQTQLREIFRGFANNSNQLTEQASHLAETAEQLNEASTHQSESSSSMAAAMEELTVSIAHVSNTAEQSAGSARESGEVAGQGRQAVEKTVGSIERIANHIGKTASDVEKLETRASEISAIINVIEEIAEQTNLLALNAAIEAARAGEQGRGFAVVADEVRKLAERTATSTSEITTMIGQIQSGTHEAVQAMKHSVEQVEEGVGLVNETGGLIVSLAESAADVGEQTNDISSALTQQKSASNDLSGNIEEVARMAEENSGRVNDVVEVAAALRELASHLRDEIARFKIN